MSNIKRNKADAAFSDYIRARAGYQCQRCQMQFVKGNAKYLHCSHNYGRGQQNIRYHPLNALALCKNCHFWFEHNRPESTPWLKEMLGEKNYAELLHAMAHHPKPKESDINKIAAHYRVLTYLINPIEPNLKEKPTPHEIKIQEKKQQRQRINDLDLMEKMLQTYLKQPEKQRKLRRAQIMSIMEKYPTLIKKGGNHASR